MDFSHNQLQKLLLFKILIFNMVSILAENHIQKCIQMPQAIKSSLATSEQAWEN